MRIIPYSVQEAERRRRKLEDLAAGRSYLSEVHCELCGVLYVLPTEDVYKPTKCDACMERIAEEKRRREKVKAMKAKQDMQN